MRRAKAWLPGMFALGISFVFVDGYILESCCAVGSRAQADLSGYVVNLYKIIRRNSRSSPQLVVFLFRCLYWLCWRFMTSCRVVVLPVSRTPLIHFSCVAQEGFCSWIFIFLFHIAASVMPLLRSCWRPTYQKLLSPNPFCNENWTTFKSRRTHGHSKQCF